MDAVHRTFRSLADGIIAVMTWVVVSIGADGPDLRVSAKRFRRIEPPCNRNHDIPRLLFPLARALLT